MKSFIVFAGLFFAMEASGQLKHEGFNNRLPSNWSSTSGSTMSLSDEHFQGGEQSLKWTATGEAKITISNLAIPPADIGSSTSGSAQFFIYSKEPSNDTLVFQFLDKAGIVKREGHMLLNYKGWRDYHRSYRFDYNNGNELPEFELNKCQIIYKPVQKGGVKTIWFDEMRFIGDTERRFPGPHMLVDARHFYQSASTAGGDSKRHLLNWGRGPDISVKAASTEELKAIKKVKAAYQRTIPQVTAINLKAAKDYVLKSAISRNQDNTIKGRAITSLANQDTLVMLANHCGSLARAYRKNNDKDARDKLLLFTEYLLDQGLAEGGRNVITTNTYAEARTFPVGFLEALPIYSPAMRSDVIKMLKWSLEYNQIYDPDFIVRLNIDYIHVKSNFLFEIAVSDPSPDVAVRDLKYIKRFFELNTMIGDGGRDGIKPDGVGVHHQSHHMSYLFSFGTWIERMYIFKGTPFKISRETYDNMSFAIRSLLLETSKGKIYSHAGSGRKPFSSVPVQKGSIEKLIEIGGDLIDAPFEPKLAALYNYIYKEAKYPVKTPDLDGFYQFNYAQMGVLRKDNWVATMRGFTDQVFGAEIYKDQNVYGRYQSYGTLEVLYDGQHSLTGYIPQGKGWDWNVIPGTTTVHLPYSSLHPKGNGSRTEFQGAAFAGALTLGKEGVFGMDFIQDPGARYDTNGLTFRKSVFAFDDYLVCLGSDIKAFKSQHNVATNLFQGITTGSNPAIYVNSTTPVNAADYQVTLPVSSGGLWMVNGQTTGYYISEGNGSITIQRGAQTTPLYTSFSGKEKATANASKAWINHGTEPDGAGYHFVTVPATTPARMKLLARAFAERKLYEVLSHTNSIHAVKYFPGNLTSYAFFDPQTVVNIGYVKSITGKALLGIRETGNTLTIHIANPDLHTVPHPEPTTKWTSAPSKVTLELSGNWKLIENPSNALIEKKDNSMVIMFTLQQGFPAELKLIHDQ